MALTSDPQGAIVTKVYLDGKEGQGDEFIFWQNNSAVFGPDAQHLAAASVTDATTGQALTPASAIAETTEWLNLKAQVAANEQLRYRLGGK